MKKIDDILAQDKKLPFTTPAGYFENLQERVMQRCVEHEVEKQKHITLWTRIRPQLAIAAGFALLVVAGFTAIKITGSKPQEVSDAKLSSYSISAADVENYVAEDTEIVIPEETKVEDEAIVNYLLCDNQVGYLASEYSNDISLQ